MHNRNRKSMDLFAYIPYSKRAYLKNYGYHFNKPTYELACSYMWKEANEKQEDIKPIEKDKLKEMLKKYNVTIPEENLYDACYVYSAAMADYFGKSLPNEQYVALHIKDRVLDVDRTDGYIFNEWLSGLEFEGIPVDFEDLLG